MKCLKKLLLSFLLLFICMFFIVPLNNNVFASTEYTVGVGEDNSYGYSVEKFNSLVKQAQEDERVTSGKYYYFVNFNYGDRCINSVLIDKSVCDLDYGYIINAANWGQNGFYHHVLNISKTDLKYENAIILSGKNPLKRDNSDIIGLSICRNKDGVFYFATNYDRIIYADKDCTKVLFQQSPTYKNPYIVNSLDSLATWKFDNLWVDYGDYDINKTIYLHICQKTVDVSGASSFYYTDSVIALSANGKYYESYEDGQVYYFSIPKDNLPFTVSSGDKIIFYLSANANNLGGAYSSDEPLKDSNIFDTKSFTVGSSYTDEDKQKDYQDKISSSLEDQKQAIEENTKTNKNIFEKIGDILSYINPFSDNFFGKKLVELILDGLKGLFVPEDGFFDTYFSDLKNWFSDRLGFLWTPFDIIIDILNKILNINFSDPIFHIPEINEPFTGSKLISEYDYNLNDLLDNEVFKNIHNIYFIGVDAVIIFALINLARRKIEEVFSN